MGKIHICCAWRHSPARLAVQHGHSTEMQEARRTPAQSHCPFWVSWCRQDHLWYLSLRLRCMNSIIMWVINNQTRQDSPCCISLRIFCFIQDYLSALAIFTISVLLPLPAPSISTWLHHVFPRTCSCPHGWTQQLLAPSVDRWAAAGRQHVSQHKAFTCSHKAQSCSNCYFWAAANLTTKERVPNKTRIFILSCPGTQQEVCITGVQLLWPPFTRDFVVAADLVAAASHRQWKMHLAWCNLNENLQFVLKE